MKLNVNGVEVEVDDRFANTPLLWVLRDVLGLRGTKFGVRNRSGKKISPAELVAAALRVLSAMICMNPE